LELHFYQKGAFHATPKPIHNLILKDFSPRWLIEKDRTEEATKSLALFRGSDDMELLQTDLDDIRANIMWHKQHSVKTAKVFFQEKALWSRLWRAWMLQFLQQMSGAAGIR
jgi:hypothetical protein